MQKNPTKMCSAVFLASQKVAQTHPLFLNPFIIAFVESIFFPLLSVAGPSTNLTDRPQLNFQRTRSVDQSKWRNSRFLRMPRRNWAR